MLDVLCGEGRLHERVPVGAPWDCWECLGVPDSDGYGRIKVRGRSILAHRLAFFVFHGRWPEPMCLHLCGNRRCANPVHLYEGTGEQNAKDRDADGMTARGEYSGARTHPESRPRGEQNSSAKLTRERVEWVRARYAVGGVTQKWLASVLGVSYQHVSRIVRGESWRV